MNNRTLHIIGICLALCACQRQAPKGTGSFLMEFVMPEEFGPSASYALQTVYMSGSMSYEFQTDIMGMVTVESVVPDLYNIVTGMELTGAQYKALVPDAAVEDNARVNVGISLMNQPIFKAEDLRIQLTSAVLKDLLISKIYYSGTKDNMDRNYKADSYVEIFNNSDEVVFLDGKYLGIADGASPAADYFPASENPDSIFLKQLCKFPGNGTDYPVQPGGSVVIAASSARNHVESASTSVDLSQADFEVKAMDSSGNPDVPMLPLISNTYPSLQEFNLTSSGPNAVMIIETDEDPLTWPEMYRKGKTSGDRWRRMHKRWVTDGIECLKKQANADPDVNTKRLQTTIDAGYAVISSVSGYTHESVERKVSREENGRVYLVDSNNSSADCVVLTDPTPRKYDKEGLR